MNMLQLSARDFLMLQSGMPLRFNVVGDIYFGPVSLHNRHEILPRLNLGGSIAAKLEGCWYCNEEGRLVRFLEKGEGVLVSENHPYLVVEVDLRRSFSEVYELYCMLTNPVFFPLQQALVVLS